MDIGITGTEYGCNPHQLDELSRILAKYSLVPHIILHHGDCIGVDAEADNIAYNLAIFRIIHPPTDPKKRAYCGCNQGYQLLTPKPYLIRNHAIVSCSSLIIAVPHEDTEIVRSGTWATVRYARATKKDIIIIYPSSATKLESF